MDASSQVKWKNEQLLVSSALLCELLDISSRTLTDWERQGCPKASRGWWVLKDVLRWRGMTSGSNITGQEPSLQEQKLRAEIAFKEVQTELSQLKNDIMAGRYLESEYVESELRQRWKYPAWQIPLKLGALKKSWLLFSLSLCLSAVSFPGFSRYH